MKPRSQSFILPIFLNLFYCFFRKIIARDVVKFVSVILFSALTMRPLLANINGDIYKEMHETLTCMRRIDLSFTYLKEDNTVLFDKNFKGHLSTLVSFYDRFRHSAIPYLLQQKTLSNEKKVETLSNLKQIKTECDDEFKNQEVKEYSYSFRNANSILTKANQLLESEGLEIQNEFKISKPYLEGILRGKASFSPYKTSFILANLLIGVAIESKSKRPFIIFNGVSFLEVSKKKEVSLVVGLPGGFCLGKGSNPSRITYPDLYIENTLGGIGVAVGGENYKNHDGFYTTDKYLGYGPYVGGAHWWSTPRFIKNRDLGGDDIKYDDNNIQKLIKNYILADFKKGDDAYFVNN